MELDHFLDENKPIENLSQGWGRGYVVVPGYFDPVRYLTEDINNAEYIMSLYLEVHGGVTYLSKTQDCHFKPSYLQYNPDDIIIGFDTSHYSDTVQSCPQDLVLIETLLLKLQLQILFMNSLEHLIKSVEDFNHAFKVRYAYTPTIVGMTQYRLRHRLMEEENNEYLDACSKGDLVEIADALGDQLYILCGTILEHGLQHKITEVFAEIHKSNMSKLDEHGNPLYREDGKVMKGPEYFRPDIKKILDEGKG